MLLGVAWLLPPEGLLPAGRLTGPAVVVDGDTLRLGEDRVRLAGIDAPELAQACTDAAGASWPCGAEARRQLARLIAARPVACTPEDRDRYGRIVASCRAGDADLAAGIVAAGLAVATDGYGSEERAARAAKRGIWAGSFAQPADWRREQTSENADGGGRPSRIELFVEWLLDGFNR